jgi:hypothetical protein
VRPGTLAVIIALLIAMIVFAFYLFQDGDGGPAPRLPLPTVETSPTASSR